MKHRRGIITSIVSSQAPQATRNTSKKIYCRICCSLAAIALLSTAYIIHYTIEVFDDNTFTAYHDSFSFPKIDSDGPISSQGAYKPESTNDCNLFDHGDISPITPNLTSVFNCNSSSGRCKWFYPAKFLNQYCGIGKKYADSIDYMERLRVAHDLWRGGPPIVLPWASLHPGIKPNGKPPGRTIPLPTHNLSMVHVHKTGGTSLVLAFSNISNNRKVKGKRMISYQPMSNRNRRFGGKMRKSNANAKFDKTRKHDRSAKLDKIRKHDGSAKFGKTPKNNANGKPRQGIKRKLQSVQKISDSSNPKNRREVSAFLDGAVKYRQNFGEREHTLFAVIRDPAERFISAIGQATGAYGSSNNGVAAWLRDECVKDTGRKTLRCFVDVMMKNETWIEVHFTPMVYEISFATLYKDIPVAVFPFIEVPTLMYELNQRPNEKKKDGKKKGYRKSEILTNLQLQDYDEGTMRDLCKVYEMDVLFMQHLGYSTKCDAYLSFK